MRFAHFASHWHDTNHTQAISESNQQHQLDQKRNQTDAAPPTQCLLAIGVLSVANRPLPRDAIRSTWGRIVQAMDGSVVLRFLIGTRPLAPHDSLALEREMATHGDILFLPHVKDDYESLFYKSLGWLEWVGQNTTCKYLFKVAQTQRQPRGERKGRKTGTDVDNA